METSQCLALSLGKASCHMCEKSFGCLLTDESFVLPSHHGIGTFYTAPGPKGWRWKHLTSDSLLPAPSRAGAALFSGSWYRIKAEFLSMKRPGHGGVYFSFTSRRCYPFLTSSPHMLLFIRLVLSSLCHSMDWSTPGFAIPHYLLELAQTHDHWVRDAIQPSHPLSSHFLPALKLYVHWKRPSIRV